MEKAEKKFCCERLETEVGSGKITIDADGAEVCVSGDDMFFLLEGMIFCPFCGSSIATGKEDGMGYRRDRIIQAVDIELTRAYAKYGRAMWTRHEFYGILMEEFIEMQEEIFKGGNVAFDRNAMEKEIIQVIGVCIRFLETGDRNVEGNLG